MIPSKRTAAFYAAYFGVLGVVLPFLGPFLTARGLDAIAVGLVTAAFSLAKLAYAPWLGRRVDRGGWMPGLLTAHMALSLAAAVVVVRAQNPWVIGIAFVAVGLGYGTVLPLVEAAVLERLPLRGYGGVRWWGSVGFIVCATASAGFLGGGGIDRFPVLLIAALVMVTAAAATLEREIKPCGGVGPETPVGRGVGFLLAILTLHQVAHGPYYAFFSINLAEHGIGAGWIAALWSLAVVVEMVAFVCGAWLQSRFGLPRLLGLALCLTPLRWVLLALPPSLPVLVLAQAGHAITFAAAHLAGVQLVQEVVPAAARRNAQALYSGLTFGLGIVVGTAAAGPLYAAVGGGGSFLVAAGFSVLVAAAWVLGSRRIKK